MNFVGLCTPGHYGPYNSGQKQNSCRKCPKGHYQPRSGKTTCLKCNHGQVTRNGTRCILNNPGNWSNFFGPKLADKKARGIVSSFQIFAAVCSVYKRSKLGYKNEFVSVFFLAEISAHRALKNITHAGMGCLPKR